MRTGYPESNRKEFTERSQQIPRSARNALLVFAILLICLNSAISQVISSVERLGSINHGAGGFSTNIEERVEDIAIDDSGNAYVIGTYSGSNALFGADTIPGPYGSSSGGMGAFLAKRNDQGNYEWIETLFDISRTQGQEVAIDHSGNVIAACRVRGDFQLDSIQFDDISRYSFLIFKMSPDQELLWYHLFESVNDNSTFNQCNGLEVNSQDEIVFSARFTDTLLVDSLVLTDYHPSQFVNGTEYMTVKFSASGSIQWVERISSFTSSSTYSEDRGNLDIDADDNVYVMSHWDTAVVGNDTFPESIEQFAIIKYSNDGDHTWTKRFAPGDGQGRGHKLKVTESGIYFFGLTTGYGEIVYDSIVLDTIYGTPMLFGKIDSAGQLLEYYTTDNTTENAPFLTDITERNGKLYLAGFAQGQTNLGNLHYTHQNVFENPVCIGYDTTAHTFEMLMHIHTPASAGWGIAVEVDSNDNILMGGSFVRGSTGGLTGTIEIDTFSISSIGLGDAFLVKRLSCNHLLPLAEIISGDSFICQNTNVQLSAASSNLNVSYQWLFSSNPIANATDSTYEAGIPGAYSLKISDSTCSVVSPEVIISSGSSVNISFVMSETSFCGTDSLVALSGGSPSGGFYSGPGVSSGLFDPSIGGGSYTIYYVYAQASGCVDSIAENVTVYNAPNTVYYPTFSNACTADTITLSGGHPVGGVYSGSGVSGNQFYAGSAGTGTHVITYTVSNSSGCSSSDSTTITVNQTPAVALNLPVDSVCKSASPVALSGHSPTGGSFAGAGVSGNYFIPQIVDAGSYIITYSYSQNGCSNSAVDSIWVDSVPQISLAPLDSICTSTTGYALTHGEPIGGVFSGSFILNNSFDAYTAGTGTHTILYTFENSCAADTAFSTITVIAGPTLTSSITNPSCHGLTNGSISTSISGGNGPYQYAWSNGANSTTIDSVGSGIFTLVVTGDGGCLAADTFMTTAPPALTLSLDSISNVVCNGFSNGMAYTSVSGGTPVYVYNWSNGSTQQGAVNLGEGFHTLLVTDANNCTDSLEVFIDETAPIQLTDSTTDVTCYGNGDGTSTVTAIGGGGSYTYSWSTGGSSFIENNLDTGVHIVTVTDQYGCHANDTILVNQPDSLMLVSSVESTTCYGSSDGGISLTSSGGNGGYGFDWNTGQTSASISGLAAGVYTVTVTDSVGCIVNLSELVEQPDSIEMLLSVSQSVLCYGDSNGGLSATIIGGSPPYNYLWSQGAISDSLHDLSADTYSLTVTDNNGCQKTAPIVLLQPQALNALADSVSNPTCFADSNGFIEMTAQGGVGIYSFTWSTSTVGNTIANLTAGIYTVTVGDSNNCSVIETVQLTEPVEMELDLLAEMPLCFGDSNGVITSTISGSQGALNYTWSNGANTPNIDSLAVGSYSLSVSDSAGCTMVSSASVTEPSLLQASVSVLPVLCNGDSTGSVSASVSGGTLPYVYTWSNGATQSSIDSLSNGNYALTITDSNSCSWDTVIVIAQPTPLLLSVDSIHDLFCYQDSSGLIAVSASGGISGYAFQWNDGSNQNSRSNLVASFYSVTATDANGCEIDTSVALTEPIELVISVDSISHNACYDDSNGHLLAQATGGTGTINFLWSNGDTASTSSNLPSGTYSLLVTDENGCISDTSLTVTSPEALILIDSIVNTTCNNTSDGSISILALGGTSPYHYSWSNGDTANVLIDIDSGEYSLTVTDDNGCVNHAPYVVGFDYSAPTVNLGSDTGFCAGDSITLSSLPTQGSYLWSTNDTSSTLLINQVGVYSLTITDTNACESADTISIASYPTPVFDLGNDTLICDDSLILGIALVGPGSMQTYDWSTGGSMQSITVSAFGTYALAVIDTNGCAYMDTIEVAADTCLGLSTPQSLSSVRVFPNPNRGQFTLDFGQSNVTSSITIYNTQGELIHRLTDLNQTRYEFDLNQFGAGLYFVSVNSSGLHQIVSVLIL